MQDELAELSVERFEQLFGLTGLRSEVSFVLPGEAVVTLRVPGRPTPAMIALAHRIEAEFDELGMTVKVCLQSSDTGWAWLKARLISRDRIR